MEIFFSVIHVLVFSALGKAQENNPIDLFTCDQDPFADACSMDDADVLIVTCPADEDCTCDPVAPATDTCTPEVMTAIKGGDPDSGIPEDIDMSKADSCRRLCGIQSEGGSAKKCFFYRWEKITTHEPAEKSSYVCKMRSCEANQCKYPDLCIENTCESGHINSEGGGALPTPVPGNPVPCPGKFNYNINNIHWHCLQMHPAPSSERSTLNPYHDEKLPHDAVCITMKRCNDWDEHADDVSDAMKYQLVARCDGNHLTQNDEEPPKVFGTWIVDEDLTGSRVVTQKMIDEGEKNKLSEPELADCQNQCEDFVLSDEVIDTPGVEVFCNKPLEDGKTIKDGNSCILLCDQELKHSVSCIYNSDDGSKDWKDDDEEPIKSEEFICSWDMV